MSPTNGTKLASFKLLFNKNGERVPLVSLALLIPGGAILSSAPAAAAAAVCTLFFKQRFRVAPAKAASRSERTRAQFERSERRVAAAQEGAAAHRPAPVAALVPPGNHGAAARTSGVGAGRGRRSGERGRAERRGGAGARKSERGRAGAPAALARPTARPPSLPPPRPRPRGTPSAHDAIARVAQEVDDVPALIDNSTCQRLCRSTSTAARCTATSR